MAGSVESRKSRMLIKLCRLNSMKQYLTFDTTEIFPLFTAYRYFPTY